MHYLGAVLLAVPWSPSGLGILTPPQPAQHAYLHQQAQSAVPSLRLLRPPARNTPPLLAGLGGRELVPVADVLYVVAVRSTVGLYLSCATSLAVELGVHVSCRWTSFSLSLFSNSSSPVCL